MRFVQLLWVITRPGRAWVGSVSNKHNPSAKSGLYARISSRITTVIHIENDHQRNYNCFNEPFAVSPFRSLYWDMHGLIFETSIWLLAGSTRSYSHQLTQVRLSRQKPVAIRLIASTCGQRAKQWMSFASRTAQHLTVCSQQGVYSSSCLPTDSM